ncbi:hypothetical protein FB45DRAFT_1030319 [Roridomyces roridus]|uniref:Uncharacterized protein n=1 Tax=Roridomyces roridus TaxID=1738132 RepID=A0AAD7BNA1_9AGAR|nr:hypothetical protein FB45DRAFT_1030319 [Roridomyces roridus]
MYRFPLTPEQDQRRRASVIHSQIPFITPRAFGPASPLPPSLDEWSVPSYSAPDVFGSPPFSSPSHGNPFIRGFAGYPEEPPQTPAAPHLANAFNGGHFGSASVHPDNYPFVQPPRSAGAGPPGNYNPGTPVPGAGAGGGGNMGGNIPPGHQNPATEAAPGGWGAHPGFPPVHPPTSAELHQAMADTLRAFSECAQAFAARVHDHTSRSTRSFIGHPDVFNGSDPAQFRPFLTQCILHFGERPQDFQTDDSKIIFVMSYLSDRAFAHFCPVIYNPVPPPWDGNFQAFSQEPYNCFGPPDAAGDAFEDMLRLEMPSTENHLCDPHT